MSFRSSVPAPGVVAARGLTLLVLILAGCTNSTARLAPPPLSPGAAAAQALATYDTDKDGQIAAGELDRCPPLKSALAAIDRDGNGKISEQELADRLAGYQSGGVAIVSLSFEVFLDKKPLEGATVTLEPEPFLGEGIKPATGTTDDTGAVSPEVAGIPGLHCGLYRVRVSKKNASGKELLPARYNTETTLGQEVAPDLRENCIILNLTRR